MNKKFIWIIVATLIIIASGVFYFLYKQQPPRVNIQDNTTYPQTSNFAFYPIHEIKLNKFNSGTYNTEGYVVKIYTCPPCPKGAQCKPCMRDNVVISENNKLLETYSLSDKEMILFVDSPKQFKLEGKYIFSIKILDYKSTGEAINDIEVVGYNIAGMTNNSRIESQDEISLELKKLNITVTGKSKQIELQLPVTLSDANWGLKKIVCEEGGYNLSAYAGQTVLLTQYLTNEIYSETEPLNVWVVSSGGKVVCVYKTITENSNMTPGVFSVKANPLIKKR